MGARRRIGSREAAPPRSAHLRAIPHEATYTQSHASREVITACGRGAGFRRVAVRRSGSHSDEPTRCPFALLAWTAAKSGSLPRGLGTLCRKRAHLVHVDHFFLRFRRASGDFMARTLPRTGLRGSKSFAAAVEGHLGCHANRDLPLRRRQWRGGFACRLHDATGEARQRDPGRARRAAFGGRARFGPGLHSFTL